MVTPSVVFVSRLGSANQASVIKTSKKRKPLQCMMDYPCMMQQHMSCLCSLEVPNSLPACWRCFTD